MTSSTLPRQEISKIRSILLNLDKHDRGKKIMQGIKKNMTAMSEAKDEDYANLRKILSYLKMKKIIK